MKSYKYKMRAEAMIDLEAFWRASPVMSMQLEAGYPAESGMRGDIETTFSSTLTIDQLLVIISGIPDGHIMFRTLNFAKKYDGDYIRTE